MIATALVASALAQTTGSSRDSTAEKATVEGIVREYPTGAPLTGCRVTLSSQSITSISTSMQAFSAGQGRFQFTDVLAGPYRVSVEPPTGHIPSRLNPSNLMIHVKAGQTLQVPQFVFARESKISGSVVSEEGRPLSGAWVYILAEGYDPITGVTRVTIAGRAQTNVDGSYQVKSLSPGSYRVEASPGSNANGQPSKTYWPSAIEYEAAESIVVPPGQEVSAIKITMRYGQTRAISINWIGNNKGLDPAHARLVPLTNSNVDLLTLGQSATAKEDGTFLIENVTAGRYSIELYSAHRRLADQEIIVETGPGEDHYALRESTAETLQGEISSGTAIADLSAVALQFMLISSGGESTQIIPLKLDRDGRFQVDICACLYRVLLPPGSDRFIAGMTLDGKDTNDSILDLRQSRGNHLVIHLSSEVSTLTISVEPQSGVGDAQSLIALFRVNESTSHPTLLESAPVRNSAARFSGIRPGRYEALVASIQDLSILADPSMLPTLQSKMKTFEIRAGSTTNLALPVLTMGELVESARRSGTELF